MQEIMQISRSNIRTERITVKTGNKEEINKIIKPSITDDQITEANNLFARKTSKEKPLTDIEKNRLQKLTVDIEKEINRLYPDFKFEVISELTGERTKAQDQYKSATDYFNGIIKLNKVDGVYELALYLEKLTNREKDPKKLESSFTDIYIKRRNKFKKYIEDIDGTKESRGAIIFKWRSKILQSENGIPAVMTEKITRAQKYEELVLADILPDYLREAVLYCPWLVTEENGALGKLKSYYKLMKSIKRTGLKISIERHKDNLVKLEALKSLINSEQKYSKIA